MASATYKTIVTAIEAYLRNSGSTGPPTSRSTKDIVKEIKRNARDGVLDVDVTDGTLLNYLSTAANNDPSSSIVSGGPHG
jgi:hypothetical protein